jgi:hypothetical protein
MDSENKIGETAASRRVFFHSSRRRSRRRIGVRLGSMLVVAIVSAGAIFASAPRVRAQDLSASKKVKKCHSTIASCGCTITKSGFYKITADLLSSQGLTKMNGCIDIKASKVTLTAGKPVVSFNFQGFNITGPGGGTPTGIGIHILKHSNGDFLELADGFVQGWDVGILVEGSNNIVEDFGAAGFSSEVPNGTAGVEINGGSNNNINDFTVDHNNNYGVWLRAASNNQINCSNTQHNGNIGVYVGCSANGPINAACAPAVPPSNNNRIFDHSSSDNSNRGVVIDLGNTGNIVTDVFTGGNGSIDMLDENPSCDNNLWFFDRFGTAMPGCID